MVAPLEPGRRAGWLVIAVRSACAGVCGVVLAALFASSGQVHDFAVGAAFAGFGSAALALVVLALRRVPWGELITAAAVTELLASIFGGRWR